MKKITLFAILLSTASAFAANDPCAISGTIELSGPTTITCFQDLKVEPGTTIITHGKLLRFLVSGTIDFTNLRLISFPAGSEPGQSAALVYIFARTLTGRPQIQNLGSGPDDESGEVRLEFLSAFEYDPVITVADHTPVKVNMNGRDYQVFAPQYQLKDAVLKQ